ncbi:hypothetical protein HAX54_049937 [Datura stramonium]|uniref:Uncharacterized protein n=1 Tax=Datura stramonium TaxID=4076 RepID=A0ABS8SVN2_DATST|nr:hypothetical protein [Datura stramonium]
MTRRVKMRLELGGGAVEDWRSGGRMTSDDSGWLECCTWSPLTWRLEGGNVEAGETERAGSRQRRRVAVGRDAESQSRRDERKRRLTTHCLEAKAMADRWGVGEMGVPTATDVDLELIDDDKVAYFDDQVVVEETVEKLAPSNEKENVSKKGKEKEVPQKLIPIPKTPPPFPKQLNKTTKEGKYHKFILILKQLSHPSTHDRRVI